MKEIKIKFDKTGRENEDFLSLINESNILSYSYTLTKDEIDITFINPSGNFIFSTTGVYNFKIVDGVVTMPNEPISDYELIKDGELYATPYTLKKYVVGKHIKCIKHPSILYDTPFGCNFWWVDLYVPEELGYMWYNSKHNSWDFFEEFVISGNRSSMCVKYKTIRAIKRAIRKWKLPIGTIVRCTGRYISETYIFEVIK